MPIPPCEPVSQVIELGCDGENLEKLSMDSTVFNMHYIIPIIGFHVTLMRPDLLRSTSTLVILLWFEQVEDVWASSCYLTTSTSEWMGSLPWPSSILPRATGGVGETHLHALLLVVILTAVGGWSRSTSRYTYAISHAYTPHHFTCAYTNIYTATYVQVHTHTHPRIHSPHTYTNSFSPPLHTHHTHKPVFPQVHH